MNMFWGQESLTLANDPDLALEQLLSTQQSWCRRAWAIISCLCSGFRSQVDLSSNPSPSTAQACWLGHHQIAIQVPFLEPLLPPPPFLTVLSKPQFRLCQCQTRRETNITNKMVKFSKTLFIIYFSGRCLSLWMKLIIYSHIGERFIRYTNRPFSNLAYSVCKGKEVGVFFFTLQSTENGCFLINVNHLLMCSVICVDYLVKNKAYLYCYIQNLLSF